MKGDVRMKDLAEEFAGIPLVYLRLKREALGLTQKEFAELFFMKKDTYRKYEEGIRKPSPVAFRLMKVLIEQYENQNTESED